MPTDPSATGPGADALTLLGAFAAALARGDATAAAECFAPDATYEEPPRFSFAGRDAIAAFLREFAAGHRDVSFEVVRALPNGDGTLLAAEWRFAHTRLRDGTRTVYAGMSFVVLANGRIASWRGYSAIITQ